jgi:hypothetical protein
MLTTDTARHGPEIAYLESGRNGYVLPADAPTYAAAYLALLDDPLRLEKVRTAAAEDARRYTLDHMVERFVGGIERCLAMPPAR